MPAKKSPKRSPKRRARGRSLYTAFAPQIQSTVFTPLFRGFVKAATKDGALYLSRAALRTAFCETYRCSVTPSRFNELLSASGVVTTLHIGVGEGPKDVPGQMEIPFWEPPKDEEEPLPTGVRETTGTPPPTMVEEVPMIPRRSPRPRSPVNALLTDPLTIPDPTFPGAAA